MHSGACMHTICIGFSTYVFYVARKIVPYKKISDARWRVHDSGRAVITKCIPFLCTPPSAITEYLNRYAHPLPEGHVDLHTRLRVAYLSKTRLDGANYRTPKRYATYHFYG
jgi:hypothetical protein